MNTKSFFPCGGDSNLILGICRENQIFFLTTPAAAKFFSQNCQKITFWHKKNSLPTQIHLCNPYRIPHTILQENYNFPSSTNKINFFDEISRSGKYCQFNEGPKFEHQTTFSLSGGSNFILGIGRKNQFFSSCCQVFFHKIVKKWH